MKKVIIVLFIIFNFSLLSSGEIIYQKTFNSANELSGSELTGWLDITDYLNETYLRIGYIDIVVSFDISPQYNTTTGWGDAIKFVKEDDKMGEWDLRAVCDGIYYDNLYTDLKTGNESYYSVYSYGGQDKVSIWAPLNNAITIRFELPHQIYTRYAIYIGKNFQPWTSRGSTYSATVELKEPQPGVYAYAGPDKRVYTHQVVEFNGGNSFVYNLESTIDEYKWNFGNGDIKYGKEVTYTFTTPGIYTVTLTVKDSLGNTNSDTCEVTVSQPESFSGINYCAPTPFDRTIYKNLKIEYKVTTDGSVSIEIYNISGEKVKELLSSTSKTSGIYEIEWDTTDDDGKYLPPGVYIAVLKVNDEVVDRKRILIKK